MPSYRLILDIIEPRPGVAPPDVVSRAAGVLDELRRVEDRQLVMRGGRPQVQLRFLIEPTNRADEEVEARAVAAEAVTRIHAEVAAVGQWVLRVRDGRARGGWPRVTGGACG